MKKILVIIFIVFLVGLSGDETALLYDDSSVAEVNITVDEAALIWIYENVWSDSMHLAQIHFENAFIDEIVENVGFRLRGNTSRLAEKKSFKLSFNDFVPGREFYGVDKMNLNGEHNDPSIIRSKLCWDLYEKIGMKASRASHIQVFINDTYYGLYISIEHIDDEFLQKHFSDDSGNLWKCHYPARLDYLGDDPELYKLENNGQRVYELKSNEEEDDYSQLARFIDLINNTPTVMMADSLEAVVDVKGILKYLAVNVLTGSWDDYWYGKNNFYIYHEPSEDRFYIIPFDYDNTFGVDWAGIDWTSRNIYEFKHPDANRPLADVFMENNQFRNLYTHFLEFYSSEVYQLSLWEEEINFFRDLIAPYAETDYFRMLDYGFTMNDFYDSYSLGNYYNQHVHNGLKEFIDLRYESLQEQIEYLDAAPVIYDIDITPGNPQAADSIIVSVSAFSNTGLDQVNIEFYPEDSSTFETYSMSYDPVINSQLVEETDRWIGFIPPLEEVSYGYIQIRAIDNEGEFQLYPRSKRILISTSGENSHDLFINELLAINDDTIADENDEYDDWIELYNASDSVIDLTGMYLSDRADNLDKWQFGSVSIAPWQHLLIWCDDNEEQGDLHTSFKLSGDGEFISLTASDGITVIDSISFGEQTADVSFGRSPDAGSNWHLMTPTPAEENVNLSYNEELLNPYKLRNYPNPFNPETRFSFFIAEKSSVLFEIYNVKGQKVITLLNDKCEGKQEIWWNGKDSNDHSVSAGIYLYRLVIDDQQAFTRKCLLLK